jgi:hypothetical protein
MKGPFVTFTVLKGPFVTFTVMKDPFMPAGRPHQGLHLFVIRAVASLWDSSGFSRRPS